MPGVHTDAQDPVCGQSVPSSGDALTSEYAGVTYHFDSAECLKRFNAEPDLFTAGPAEGKVADDDRFLHPEQHTHARGDGRPVPAVLEQPRVESGSG
jgi:YHS domain-containing protein